MSRRLPAEAAPRGRARGSGRENRNPRRVACEDVVVPKVQGSNPAKAKATKDTARLAQVKAAVVACPSRVRVYLADYTMLSDPALQCASLARGSHKSPTPSLAPTQTKDGAAESPCGPAAKLV